MGPVSSSSGPVAGRLGAYDLLSLAGRGGMAEVWRAVARSGPLAGRDVAVKRLRAELSADPEFLALFEQEAAVTRRLHHPAVVEVLDAGVDGATPYLVMDYVDGRNLRDVLGQCGQRAILLPPDFCAFLAHVVAQALDHAHVGVDAAGLPLGIVHCDVSPSNVFISRLGEIKLGDFGVALSQGFATGQTAGAFGKIHYLAPEQLRGDPVGPRTDLFALGSLLFELLTNQKAFPGTSINAVGQRILRGELRAPSEVRPELPFELDELVLRCLALDPADRWESAAAFGAAVAGRYDTAIGTPLAIAAVVRGLFGATG